MDGRERFGAVCADAQAKAVKPDQIHAMRSERGNIASA
jgi:hypothetical protein